MLEEKRICSALEMLLSFINFTFYYYYVPLKIKNLLYIYIYVFTFVYVINMIYFKKLEIWNLLH